MITAITRQVSPRLAECEISFQARQPIDVAKARAQHAAYCSALAALGANVMTLPTLEDHPDCVFVEDAAIILDEVAILTRPGAESRRGEVAAITAALESYHDLLTIEAPATLDGGDVMRLGKTLYVGLSRRTNIAGVQQLAKLTAPYGYWVTPVEVRGCLHLKSAVCPVGTDTVLANRAWLDLDAFCGVRFIDVAEPHAANVLVINGSIVMPASFPATRAVLEQAGLTVVPVDTSELMKAEAGVTCMSLLIS